MSPALLAYYNPIRQSRRHAATSPLSRLIRRAFAVRARRGDPRDLPYFHCRTVHTCRRPYAGGSGRPPVTMASRYQASSTSQRVATHNCPSLPAIPDGVKHFGAASFASCCGPCVCLALLTGYPARQPVHHRDQVHEPLGHGQITDRHSRPDLVRHVRPRRPVSRSGVDFMVATRRNAGAIVSGTCAATPMWRISTLVTRLHIDRMPPSLQLISDPAAARRTEARWCDTRRSDDYSVTNRLRATPRPWCVQYATWSGPP